jgi:hypothetical protein
MVLRLDLGADIIFPRKGGNLVRPWEPPFGLWDQFAALPSLKRDSNLCQKRLVPFAEKSAGR